MKTGNTDFIYKNDFDKACFQHDTAYGKFKNLTRRTQSDKVLRVKAFEIQNMQVIQNMMVINEDQLQWYTGFLIKYLLKKVLKNEIKENQ